jgi:hypothetical protein
VIKPEKQRPAPKEPLFVRFCNKEASVLDLLHSFSKSSDLFTSELAIKTIKNPPDMSQFHKELVDAVTDIIKTGPSEDFKAFVNHYMGESLIEDYETRDTDLGENISRSARVVDENTPWVQGLVCYNLCLYIKAFGLEDLKKCKVCSKFFCHKGKWAVYCSDVCKKASK